MVEERNELEESDRKLRREMSFQQLLFVSLGSMIGSGWLFAALAAGSIAGPIAIVAWVLGALLIIIIALAWVEIACAIPRSGAIARYPYLTHGGLLGFLMGWSYLIASVTTPTIEAIAVVTYASGYVEDWVGVSLTTTAQGVTVLTSLGVVAALALMLLFFFVNLFGIRFFASFNLWITWWKLIIPTLTFVLLFFTFNGSNFTAYGGVAPRGVDSIFVAVASSGIAFAFLGFRQALDFGGEARNPQRDIPAATILSVVIAAAMYIGLQVAFIGAIEWGAAGVQAGNWSALQGSDWADQPLYAALDSAGLALLGAFGVVLLFDAALSPTGTGWIYTGVTARISYGIAVYGDLPRSLQRISERYRIPWVALVATVVVGSIFLAPLPSWYLLVGVITAGAVLTFTMGAVNLPVMRRVAPDLPRPFYLRGAAVVAPLAAVGGVLIFYWSSFETLVVLITALFIALPIYALFGAPRRGFLRFSTGVAIGVPFLVVWILTQYFGPMSREILDFPVSWALSAVEVVAFTTAVWLASDKNGKREVNATWWLLFLLLALYLLSYYGAYGPLDAPPIPFPWDTLVAIGIGLVAYYWGAATGYLTDELQAVVESGSGVVPEEERKE